MVTTKNTSSADSASVLARIAKASAFVNYVKAIVNFFKQSNLCTCMTELYLKYFINLNILNRQNIEKLCN